MTGLSSAPRLAKGALVGIDPMNPLASVVIFQYNPSEMSRALTERTQAGDGGSGNEQYKIVGAPHEKISMQIEIDAADQLEQGDAIAAGMGIYPQLAALEMIMYPKSADVIKNTALALAGSIEIIPDDPPMTLFIWGAKRVLPVKLASYSVTETLHDAQLNPLQAHADISLDVLTYSDFGTTHPGYYVYLAHQVVKETMAVVGSVASAKGGY